MANIEHDGIPVLNQTDHDWCRNLYLMWAGAYGDTKCFVWANSFDDAFEHLVEWLDDEAPGLLTRLDYVGAALELEMPTTDLEKLTDEQQEQVREHAEMDMALVGHTTLKNGDAIASHEWGADEIGGETFAAVFSLSQEDSE